MEGSLQEATGFFPDDESGRSLVYDRWDRTATAMSLTMALRYCSNLI